MILVVFLASRMTLPGVVSPAVLERFGPGILLFGKVVNHALSSHLAGVASDTNLNTSRTDKIQQSTVAARQPARTDAAPPFDVDIFETTSHGLQLRSRMNNECALLPNSGGETTEEFTEAGQLGAVLAKCQGRQP